ncbi:hypothetical protein HDU84_007205 [Entophlyctis sp. JEL0112]|nr:hypothetical protein HDU84_007205 [Entophlyctis sp. JEL0112]
MSAPNRPQRNTDRAQKLTREELLVENQCLFDEMCAMEIQHEQTLTAAVDALEKSARDRRALERQIADLQSQLANHDQEKKELQNKVDLLAKQCEVERLTETSNQEMSTKLLEASSEKEAAKTRAALIESVATKIFDLVVKEQHFYANRRDCSNDHNDSADASIETIHADAPDAADAPQTERTPPDAGEHTPQTHSKKSSDEEIAAAKIYRMLEIATENFAAKQTAAMRLRKAELASQRMEEELNTLREWQNAVMARVGESAVDRVPLTPPENTLSQLVDAGFDDLDQRINELNKQLANFLVTESDLA